MASIPNNGYAEVMSGSNNYTGSNSFDGSCPQTAIAPVVANDLCNRLYVDTIAGGGSVVSVVAGNNIVITGTTPSPVVNLKSPLTSTLALGTQNITGTTSNIIMTDNAAFIQMGGNGIIPTLYGHQGINRQDPGNLIIENSVVGGGNGIQLNCVSGVVSTQGAFQPQRILDTAGGSGTVGQVLSSLGAGTGTSWINDGGTPTITDTNTNATYYPVFVAGSGVQPLLADIATTTTSINPSNGNFSVVDTLKLTQDTVSIGKSAGTTQGGNAIAIGTSAGGNQTAGAVAVGSFAGNGSQGAAATAIGFASGYSAQGASSTAIGGTAGNANQGAGATAVGYGAGNATQGDSATAVGASAGGSGQGNGAVAIGANAGSTNQGANAIAIGVAAGITNQTAGSICLNASGAAFNPNQAGCFINPIRGVALGIGVGRVFYNTTTFELQYSTT
jgi:hypothetical protein